MKMLFSRWSKVENALYNKDLINERLTNARNHCPREFQRKPQTLKKLADWKATQFRMFLLYIGVVVLHGALEEKCLRHFYVLVISIRSMCRRVDRTCHRQEILNSISSICTTLLKYFFTKGVELFSKTFAVSNVHGVIHIPQDYRRFGPLDSFSAFKYESFLGRLKSLVTAAFQPMTQVINKYPSLLLNIGKNRATNHIEEFNEIPELRLPEQKKKNKQNDDDDLDDQYRYYKEMKFKNFTVRTDLEGDRYVVMGTGSYVRVEKILQNMYTDEIFITGKTFSERRPLFSIREPLYFNSEDVGISVCANLSSQTHTYKLSQLNEKCFALPLYPEKESNNEEWVRIRFLH